MIHQTPPFARYTPGRWRPGTQNNSTLILGLPFRRPHSLPPSPHPSLPCNSFPVSLRFSPLPISLAVRFLSIFLIVQLFKFLLSLYTLSSTMAFSFSLRSSSPSNYFHSFTFPLPLHAPVFLFHCFFLLVLMLLTLYLSCRS